MLSFSQIAMVVKIQKILNRVHPIPTQEQLEELNLRDANDWRYDNKRDREHLRKILQEELLL